MLTVYMSAGPWRASCGKSRLSGASYSESCLSGASCGESLLIGASCRKSRLSNASYDRSRLSGAGRKPAHCAFSGSAGPDAATAEFRTCGPPWWGSLNRRGWHLHQYWAWRESVHMHAYDAHARFQIMASTCLECCKETICHVSLDFL